MNKVLIGVFFLSWLVVGCSLETVFERPCNMAVTVIALVVAILSAMAMGGGQS